MRPGLFIQSRMDSTRLPGKATLELNGRTTLGWVIKNTKSPFWVTTVLTTDREVDDPIEAIALAEGVKCFRWNGDPNDVLGRFYHGVRKTKVIVRVTADCLGLDTRTVNEVLSQLRNSRVRYAYASPDKGYPRGYGCEAFTSPALMRANRLATSAYDREHVTPFMQLHERDSTWEVKRYDDFNMELNTLEDYERIKNVYNTLH